MEAYIYTYVNIETKKTYIGARCAYVGSCYDDFNIKYFSSSKDKQFRQDMSDGKLEGQIVLVMNDDNADKKIFEVEAKMIKAYWDKYGKENSYNHYAAGKFSTAGMHPNVGRHLSDETKEKIRASIKGKKASEETRKKLSIAGKSRHHSEETKRKISEANKGRIVSEETKAKMRGRHYSEESIAKMRTANIGEKNPFYGRHHSEETKAKMRASAKRKKNENMKKGQF